jgi:hypothetical protein
LEEPFFGKLRFWIGGFLSPTGGWGRRKAGKGLQKRLTEPYKIKIKIKRFLALGASFLLFSTKKGQEGEDFFETLPKF